MVYSVQYVGVRSGVEGGELGQKQQVATSSNMPQGPPTSGSMRAYYSPKCMDSDRVCCILMGPTLGMRNSPDHAQKWNSDRV